MGGDGGRASYLFDGRRVRVRDLLDAGLIAADEQLTFTRPRFGERHTAFVGPSGSLRVDGRTYATPSAAAKAAARATTHSGQFDGWIAWTTEAGATLHALRQQLLDKVAAEVPTNRPVDDGQDESESSLPRHEFLKQARDAAERGRPMTITVRDLVRHWGASTRGSQVSQRIAADLDNHGLATDPDFLSVTLDDEVVLTAVQPEQPVAVSGAAVATDTVTMSAVSVAPREHREIGLTLGNLIKRERALEWVKPTATVEEAMTKMLVNDYSQLPVLKNKYTLEGAVTWQSIAQARLKDPGAPLSAATVPATKFSYSDDLNNVLPRLQDENFVVVTNHHNEITGIVTTADVVALYQERTLPFLLIGELDQELRRLIGATIPFDTVRAVCAQPGRPELTSFDDMTMGDYQQVLANTECWMVLGWPLDRGSFVKRIDELRRIRNDITHFNPDPAPEDTVDKLRHMLNVIRMFGPSDGL